VDRLQAVRAGVVLVDPGTLGDESGDMVVGDGAGAGAGGGEQQTGRAANRGSG
jgi:hypothetical protein